MAAGGGVLKPVGKTGNAMIKQVGHTASAKHGANENAKVRGGAESRDLKVK